MTRLCVALDARDPDRNLALAGEVADHVGYLKLGLTSFTGGGDRLAERLSGLRPLFIDLKLHDIPGQVASAVENIAGMGASLTTVHGAGGADMIKAAVAAAPDDLKVVAVTVLTSLDDVALERTGIQGPAQDAVLRLADLALGAGADGLVCSPLEIEPLRARFGDEPFLVVPGIRATASSGDDQKRTRSAPEAARAGADLLVVGRPITAAPDARAAARELAAQMS